MNPPQHIQAACAALFAPGQVTELCALAYRQRRWIGNAAGWFADRDAFVRAAVQFDTQQKPEGIYCILNRLHDGCLARSNNQMLELGGKDKQRTSDNDIVRRHWLVIDLDPIRPKGISSSNEELDAAARLAETIRGYLEDRHWPAGLLALSGNGYHLLYRVDLPNDEEAKNLIVGTLKALHDKFTTPIIDVDTTTSNAARLWKLYGTVARKGVDMPDRPHRRAEILTEPIPTFEAIEIVTPAQLADVAGTGRRPSPAAAKPGSGSGSQQRPTSGNVVDLDAFIARHGISVRHVEPWDGGTRYVLHACVFDPSHIGSSAAIGRTASGEIFYRCQHASCSARGWSDVVRQFEGREHAKPAADDEGKQSSDPYDIAGDIIEEEWQDSDLDEMYLRYHRSAFYVYSPVRRAYRPVSDDEIDVIVTRRIYGRVEKVTRGRVRDVLGCLRARVSILGSDELDPPFMTRNRNGLLEAEKVRKYLVTMKNGILDVTKLAANCPAGECLIRHTSDWFTLTALPFDFPVDKNDWECPAWLDFLAEIFEGDQERIDVLQEAFGYCYCLDTRFEKFFILHGMGRNGKTTALQVLRSLLSERCCSEIALAQFSDPRMVYELYGKLANICGDAADIDRVQEDVLKKAISGDGIQADRKYKDAVKFRPFAKLFFATNELPQFNDSSEGIWRRMIIIPFDYQVPARRIDTQFFERRLKPELAGIFIWAIKGLARLLTTEQWTVSAACEEAKADHRRRRFPILSFLEECTEQTDRVIVKDLWECYKAWCRDTGLSKPKPLTPFWKDARAFLKQLNWNVDIVKPQRRNEGEIMIHGISIAPGLSFWPPARGGHVQEYDV